MCTGADNVTGLKPFTEALGFLRAEVRNQKAEVIYFLYSTTITTITVEYSREEKRREGYH